MSSSSSFSSSHPRLGFVTDAYLWFLNSLSYDQWWAHGWTHLPPKEGDFMSVSAGILLTADHGSTLSLTTPFQLPAGGTYTAELHCNRAFTNFRSPFIDPSTSFPDMACQSVGSLHTVLNFGDAVDDTKLGGT